jgi:hypothetical protein
MLPLAVGRLLLEGRLLTVGRLVLTRPELLPALAEAMLVVGRLDMLPLLRPLLGKAWLIEPVDAAAAA